MSYSKVLCATDQTIRGNRFARNSSCRRILRGRRERRCGQSSPRGKIAAYLALKDNPDICVRGGNGPNAGHTVFHEQKQYSLRLIPSGFVNQSSRLLIGPGVPVDVNVLMKELEETETDQRTGVDYQCPIIEERHKLQEKNSEHLARTVGSTKSGVGACNAERALRMVKLARQVPKLQAYTCDSVAEIHEALSKNHSVMVEGTQGTFLSLYHGTYPYVTSKDVTASQACADVGIGPTQVDNVIVIFKSYVTRVGEGPLEGQLTRAEVLKRGWMEHGTVTGRERRAAPFDFRLAKRAVELNSATQIALTKLDILFPETKGMRNFSELPREAREFVSKLEAETSIPVSVIGTGPSEQDVIDLRSDRKTQQTKTTPVRQKK